MDNSKEIDTNVKANFPKTSFFILLYCDVDCLEFNCVARLLCFHSIANDVKIPSYLEQDN